MQCVKFYFYESSTSRKYVPVEEWISVVYIIFIHLEDNPSADLYILYYVLIQLTTKMLVFGVFTYLLFSGI